MFNTKFKTVATWTIRRSTINFNSCDNKSYDKSPSYVSNKQKLVIITNSCFLKQSRNFVMLRFTNQINLLNLRQYLEGRKKNSYFDIDTLTPITSLYVAISARKKIFKSLCIIIILNDGIKCTKQELMMMSGTKLICHISLSFVHQETTCTVSVICYPYCGKSKK